MTEKPDEPTSAPTATTEAKPPTAREIAAALDRRQRRRRIFLLLLLAAAIALAVIYGTCGKGWGLGAGKGEGAGSGSGSVRPIAVLPDGPPARCAIRVAGGELPYTLDDKPSSVDAILTACAAGVDVTVTGDAREGDWTTLREALAKAGIAISVREPKAPR